MFVLILENHLGQRIRLTQNPNYAVTDIDGLNPPKANINMGENANLDGATFNSSRLNTRQIVITVRPLNDVEANRIALYTFVKSKKNIKVFFANSTRDVYIAGYVSACEIDLFKQKEAIQITILCPDPYFRSAYSAEADFSNTFPLFQFEMDIPEGGMEFSRYEETPEVSVINYGDVETGATIEITALGTATNPTIVNETTQQLMKFNITLVEGDVLRIDTNKGKKSVMLIHDGTETNALSALDMTNGVTWLTLESGSNVLSFSADTGEANLNCFLTYDNLFEGV
jgi:hypothetical protein